jgi:hypothetical protein
MAFLVLLNSSMCIVAKQLFWLLYFVCHCHYKFIHKFSLNK